MSNANAKRTKNTKTYYVEPYPRNPKSKELNKILLTKKQLSVWEHVLRATMAKTLIPQFNNFTKQLKID